MKWSWKEDYIVCSFYLSHVDTWANHVDELMLSLHSSGYETRSKGSVRMRVQNYMYLHLNKGLSNCAIQSRNVYLAFSRRTTNMRLRQGIKSYINESYTATDSMNKEVKTSGPFGVVAPDASGFIYTEPLGPTFQEILFDFIDKRGMKDSEVYNACLVGRDTFSHIRKGDKGVSKRTVKQLCFGLKLTYDEAVVLMTSAGYAFSSSNLSDVIVAYYLKNRIYDIDDVNITLYENNAELLFTA